MAKKKNIPYWTCSVEQVECCVSSSGGNFEDICEDVYDTICDAIEAWCERPALAKASRQRKKWWTSSTNTSTTRRTPTIIYTHLSLISTYRKG